MKIRKAFQGTIPENKILDTYSTSQTDTYSCNYVNSKLNYSTDETVVGKWIDNKPLYRKVFKITNTNNPDINYSLDVSSLNIERMVKLNGFTYSASFGQYIDFYMYNVNAGGGFMYYDGNTISYNFHWSADEVYIIIEYTKTTD